MSNSLKTDLALAHREMIAESSSRSSVDFKLTRGNLLLFSGKPNLAQAIKNRLYTRVGELKQLGHPSYGSRLYELIGEPKTWRTKALAELYVRESLAYEKRIAKIVEIVFPPSSGAPEDRNTLNMTLILEPIDQSENLTLSLAVNLGN